MVVAHNRDKFNCQACPWNRHCDDGNPAPFPIFAIEEIGLESHTCLLPMVTEESREVLGMYRHYKNGLLPFGGGVMDQPAAFSAAMLVVDSAVSKQERKG